MCTTRIVLIYKFTKCKLFFLDFSTKIELHRRVPSRRVYLMTRANLERPTLQYFIYKKKLWKKFFFYMFLGLNVKLIFFGKNLRKCKLFYLIVKEAAFSKYMIFIAEIWKYVSWYYQQAFVRVTVPETNFYLTYYSNFRAIGHILLNF